MKDKRHIESFGQFNENLNISDVSVSLLVPLKTLNEWIDAIDSMEYSLNQRLYVNDNIKEFIKTIKTMNTNMI